MTYCDLLCVLIGHSCKVMAKFLNAKAFDLNLQILNESPLKRTKIRFLKKIQNQHP